MNILWDHDAPPPSPLPYVGVWRKEAKPLSWFKNRHSLAPEKKEAAAQWFRPQPGETRPPTLIPEAYDDGLLRDGHHRIDALKTIAKGHDLIVPVWVLHRNTDVETRKDPVKLDRFQAPAGGAIVNNQYLPGGRFLPKALRSIREVMALRKKRGQRKAEATARMAATTEPEKMIAPAIAAVAGTVARTAAVAAPRAAAGAAGTAGSTGARLGVMDVLGMVPTPQPRRDDRQEFLARGEGEGAMDIFGHPEFRALVKRGLSKVGHHPVVADWLEEQGHPELAAIYRRHQGWRTKFLHWDPKSDFVSLTGQILARRTEGDQETTIGYHRQAPPDAVGPVHAVSIQHRRELPGVGLDNPASEYHSVVAPVTGEELKAIVGRYTKYAKSWAGFASNVREYPEAHQLARKPVPPMALTEVIRKKKLLTPGTPRRQLTDPEIRKIEDAHDLAPSERLVRTVHPETGKVSTNLNNFYTFQDHLAAKRLGPDLHKVLNDPGTPDYVKEAHLTHHVLHDAGHVLRQMTGNDAEQWYGASMDGWEAAMHHLLSRDRPGDPSSAHVPDHPQWGTYDHQTGKVMGSRTWLRLMKAPLSFTSGSATPSKNARAAYRMVISAMRHHPANPFSHLPEVDHETYHQWQQKARAALGVGHDHPFTKVSTPGATSEQKVADAVNWHKLYAPTLKAAGVEPGYSTMPALFHKETGEAVARIPFKSGDAPKPIGQWSHAQVAQLAKAKKLRVDDLPNPGADGHLMPKGWGKQSAAVKASARRLAKLIADKGEEGALEFLDSHQPVAELKKYNPGFSFGGAAKQATAPGAFIFGPKYGPFYLNISGKKDHFTLDKWMARLAYTYTGAMMDAKTGRAEGPRSSADSKVIVDAFKKAAGHLRLAPADLQAVMWDMVQRVPNLFGVDHEEDDFRKGGQELLREHGVDPSVIEPHPATPLKGAGARRGGGVQGIRAGGRGSAGGKGAPRGGPVTPAKGPRRK